MRELKDSAFWFHTFIYWVPHVEPGTTLLLDTFFITTEFLRRPLCNLDTSWNGSGNRIPVNFTFLARLVWKSSPQQWWKAGWFIQSFTWRNSIWWSFKSAHALNKIGNAFSINNAAHFVLLSLDPFADSKKKKRKEEKYCGVLLHKSQTPLERAL